ncbi:hypothetical protein NDU88_000326 [Pleurodeles waltl]|uniref:Uncharacterized protein n=1 Tax=Pleurodeles waltl TaxID=8319 RepID=A0AAV7VVT0_PLEWA|nr:hypothetical protein NDU88_000326 [Pleurodeles waltl]
MQPPQIVPLQLGASNGCIVVPNATSAHAAHSATPIGSARAAVSAKRAGTGSEPKLSEWQHSIQGGTVTDPAVGHAHAHPLTREPVLGAQGLQRASCRYNRASLTTTARSQVPHRLASLRRTLLSAPHLPDDSCSSPPHPCVWGTAAPHCHQLHPTGLRQASSHQVTAIPLPGGPVLSTPFCLPGCAAASEHLNRQQLPGERELPPAVKAPQLFIRTGVCL